MPLDYRILTQDGTDNTGTDGARDRYFAAGGRDGIMKGSLNEGTFVALGEQSPNVIMLDTCVLLICGNPVIIDQAWTKTFSSRPSASERRAIVAQIIVDNNRHKTFDILDLPASTTLVKDKLFKTENSAGTYQVEIGRFTLNTDSTVSDVIRTLDLITGGGTADSELHWGTITAYALGHNEDPEADFEQRYDEEQGYMVTDVSLGIPSGSIDNLDDTLSPTSHNAIENQAVTNALNNKADASDVTNKMDKTNPTGTGSFSLNRSQNGSIGNNSVAVGSTTVASGDNSHAEGNGTTAAGDNSHSEGNFTKATGDNSHAEGNFTKATGDNSHAEGNQTEASGNGSHVEGSYTIAQRSYQHVFGKFNIADTQGIAQYVEGKYIEIVGNGTSGSTRSNARELEWNGNERIAGRHQADGGYTDGNNANYSAKLPDTTGWTSNKTIAMTDLLPVGSLVACVRTTVPTGWLWCNGSTFNQADYPELYSVLGTNVLPDMNHCFPEGTSTASEIYSGTNTQPIDAGLPDITGQFDCNSRDGTINNTGAFGRISSGSNQVSNATNIKGKVTVGFKASDGEIHSGTYRNDIYGKSDTVQPKSYRFMYLIKAV